MKFPPFEYIRVSSVPEAVELLERYGADARILAGGQSLLPMLAFRMSSPHVLIDISHVSELRFIEEGQGVVRLGALTRHADLERNPTIAQRLPLLAKAAPNIAHIAIRNRGTLGGSLSLADPAAQLPACMLALDATMVATGPNGPRHIPASEFFTGTFETALTASEVLTHVQITAPAAEARAHFAQLSRRHGDFAMVGLAALGLASESRANDVRLVYLGCGDRPMRAPSAEALLRDAGARPSLEDGMRALEQDLEPSTDLQATSEMRIYLAAVLLQRAAAELMNPDG